MSEHLEGRRTPLDLTPEAFAEAGHRLVDDVAGLLASMRDRPLGPSATGNEIREALDASAPLPEHGTDASEVMAEATRLLFDHSVFNGHPRFFGYVTAAPAPIGMLADLLAAAVNPNVGAWALAPMATEMEKQSVRWISELVGYPTSGDGVLTSGGNVANMIGFWAARAAKADWNVRETGLTGRAGEGRAVVDGAGRLVAYCVQGTHTWIHKATDLSGLGTDAIRWIPTDSSGRMDPRALRERIEADRAAGARPFFVVGTAGSVGTGSVDPLPELRAICDEHDLWLHVDGAYGGFAAAAPSAPADLKELALADSVALDPHKWLYLPLEAGCTLVRDPAALVRAFSYRPDYFEFGAEEVNYHERGIQNSRGFRALKVWCALRQVGRSGYARMIDEDIQLARRFHEMAGAHPELEALTQGLSISTYRYVPQELRGWMAEPEVAVYLDELNQVIRDRMETEGQAFVSNAIVNGVYALRMCIVNFRTTLEDVRRLAEYSVELGRAEHARLWDWRRAGAGWAVDAQADGDGSVVGPDPGTRGPAEALATR